MDPTTHVADIAQSLLDEVIERLGNEGIELPERRFVHAGQTVHDCEQLSVSFVRIYNGVPGREVAGEIPCAMTKTAEFTIQLVRCVPSLDENELPSGPELHASGLALATDAFALWRGLILAYKEKTLARYLDMAVGPVEALDALGGFGGTSVTVSVQL